MGTLAATTASAITTLRTQLEQDKLRLAQIRMTPLDDIQIAVFQPRADRLYSTKLSDSLIEMPSPVHDEFLRNALADTETLIRRNTANRSARLIGLVITNEDVATREVRLGDGDGTGTDASAANADFSFQVGPNETLSLGEDDIPNKEFFTGITSQHAGAVQIRVSIEVREVNRIDTFRDGQNREIYVFEDIHTTHIQVTNPTRAEQTTNRVQFEGFKFRLIELESEPQRFTPVPVAQLASKGNR